MPMNGLIFNVSTLTTSTTINPGTPSNEDQLAIYLVTDNTHIVVPLISFVFGFPILVVVILCIIQQRNKCYYKKQEQMRLQNQRLSTVSTLHSFPMERDRANSMFSARLSVSRVDQAELREKSNYQRRSYDASSSTFEANGYSTHHQAKSEQPKVKTPNAKNYNLSTPNAEAAEKLSLLNV